MFQSDQAGDTDAEAAERIVMAGAGGAITLAGVATAIVLALWFAFYFLVFVPRALMP
jgi:hypothetical protein